MTIRIIKCSDSVWFGYWSRRGGSHCIRDLGDFAIWIFRFEITIWFAPMVIPGQEMKIR